MSGDQENTYDKKGKTVYGHRVHWNHDRGDILFHADRAQAG